MTLRMCCLDKNGKQQNVDHKQVGEEEHKDQSLRHKSVAELSDIKEMK